MESIPYLSTGQKEDSLIGYWPMRRLWRCYLCGRGPEGRAVQTYFCNSHSDLIQEWITAGGQQAALMWLDRAYYITQIAKELEEFAKVRHKFRIT